MNNPNISVVIPTRNEEANVVQIAEAVIREMETTGLSFDVILIDNASQDRTVELARDLCARDSRVRLIVNARDFGQMRSPTYGIFQAKGDAIINLCADFQDPPTLIPEFVARWQAGTDIVLGVRQSEKSSRRLSAVRNFSYWFANRFGDYPTIPNATGFGLYDKKVVRAIERLKEPEPFFRGMLVETGYSIETIPFPRPSRAGGKSNNNFFTLIDFMLSSLSSATKMMVRIPYYLGVLSLMTSGLMLLGSALSFLITGGGWGWLIATMLEFNFGAMFIFLGVIGDQTRLVSERTRQTPLVIERERVNFPSDY